MVSVTMSNNSNNSPKKKHNLSANKDSNINLSGEHGNYNILPKIIFTSTENLNTKSEPKVEENWIPQNTNKQQADLEELGIIPEESTIINNPQII